MGLVTIHRGDIVLLHLGTGKGSEQTGTRPGLIIQNNLGNKHSPTTIIAPLTSTSFDKEYPTNVHLTAKDCHLRKDSTILLNQIRTIDRQRITKKISSLDKHHQNKVDRALRISLGL